MRKSFKSFLPSAVKLFRDLIAVAKAAKKVEYDLENAKDCDCCNYNRKLIDEELTPALQALESTNEKVGG